MASLTLVYYLIVGSLSILLNTFIILASIRFVRGEFKWVFLGSSATNVLLSTSQLLLMPGAMHWPGNELQVIVSANPWMEARPSLCSLLYEILYFRQLEASVLCICLVPLNRACAICWKSIAPTNAKLWTVLAIVPNVVPFIFLLFVRQFPGTAYSDLSRFSPPALQKLAQQKIIVCTLTSHFLKVRDVLQTSFFLLCPMISYPVAILCVCKLLIFVWKSQRSVRGNVSQLVLQRQKGILVTICIQAIAPLIFFSPLFVSMLFGDRDELHPNEWSSAVSVHLMTAICPLVDAVATVACLKPFRRILLHCGTPPRARWESRKTDSQLSRRPPSRGAPVKIEEKRPAFILSSSTDNNELIETRV